LTSSEKQKQFAPYVADLILTVSQTQLSHIWRKYIHLPPVWLVWPNMLWQPRQQAHLSSSGHNIRMNQDIFFINPNISQHCEKSEKSVIHGALVSLRTLPLALTWRVEKMVRFKNTFVHMFRRQMWNKISKLMNIYTIYNDVNPTTDALYFKQWHL